MKQIVACLALLILLSAGCTKDAEIQEREYPLVRTLLTSTNESITFTGELLSKGSQEIISYGFVYDSLSSLIHSYNYRCDTILILGKPDDKFSVVLQAGFVSDKQYRVRSFVRTAEQYVVGTTQNFIFNGSKPVELYSFSPARGTIGDTVVIEGKYFSRSMRGNIVTFGNDTAKVVAVYEGKLCVEVPEIPVEQICQISVTSPTSFANLQDPFERWYNWSRIYDDLPDHYHRGTKVGDFFVMFDFRTQSTLVFNVLTGSYFNAAQFPGPGSAYVAPSFSCEGKAYFMFEYSDNFAKELWEYNPYSDQWTRKQDLPNKMKSSIRPFVIGSKAYLFLSEESFWEYDALLDLWTMKSNPGQSYPAFTLSAAGKGYVGFGGDKISVFEYDPSADTWHYKTDYPGLAKYCPIAFYINGRIYIGLGQYNNLYTCLADDMWEFSPGTGQWKQSHSFPDKARPDRYTIEVYSEDGYAIRHYSESYVTDVYKFDPDKQ